MSTVNAYYLVNLGGLNLFLPAEDILYLASSSEIQEKEEVSCLQFAERWHPVYSLTSACLPAMGLQNSDRKAILLNAEKTKGSGSALNSTAMALGCLSIIKMRIASTPYPLPSLMRRINPIEGLLRHNSEWHLFSTSVTIQHYFEEVLSYGSNNATDLPHGSYVGMVG